MKVLAIDPGYDRLGIAIIEKTQGSKEQLLYSECFETTREINFYERLGLLGQHVRSLIKQWQPEVMVIEGLFFSKNTKTALQVSEARGVIIFQAIDKNIPVYEYTPNQIKVAVTGYGRASKNDIHTMVHQLIHMEMTKRKDDEIDAIAIGLTFFANNNALLNKL